MKTPCLVRSLILMGRNGVSVTSVDPSMGLSKIGSQSQRYNAFPKGVESALRADSTESPLWLLGA